MAEIKPYSMSDVGTRLSHLMDLQDLWSSGLQILTSPGYHHETEKQQARELETALKLLSFHMMSDFTPTNYAKEINNLPKDPKEIT